MMLIQKSENLESPSINPNDKFVKLLVYIFTRQTSAFIIVFGRRESGKTDISFLISEILYATQTFKHIGTNVKIYSTPFQIEYITNLADLTGWCQRKKGRKLFILDEAGRAFKRRTPMSKINVEIIDKLQILRKYKLSFLWATPNEQYIDRTALRSDILDGVFTKPTFKNKKIALYDDQIEGFHYRFWNIPKTSIKFDTWDSATFTLGEKTVTAMFEDDDLKKLWRYAEGGLIKDLGWHPQEFRRKLRSYLKESLKERITNHKH